MTTGKYPWDDLTPYLMAYSEALQVSREDGGEPHPAGNGKWLVVFRHGNGEIMYIRRDPKAGEEGSER